MCLHTSIAVISAQLKGFKYCYQTQMILFNIKPLFAHSEVITSIAI